MKLLTTRIVLCLFAIFLSNIPLHAQQFQWVKGGGSPWSNTTGQSSLDEGVYYMCTDPSGNTYALSFVGPTPPLVADTFYRASGAYGAAGVNVNILITSYNCSGQMRWAKLLGTAYNTYAYGIKADSLGHIYVAGDFVHNGGSSTVYIGYDTAITGLLDEAFGVVQLDTSGNFNWIQFIGNNTIATLSGEFTGQYSHIAIDGMNNIHFLPYLRSGVSLMTGIISQCGVYDMTYDPSGTLLSAVRLDMDSEWFLHDAVIDPVTNKLYVCGEIYTTTLGVLDSFYAAAFDAGRSRLWQYFAGHGDDNGISAVVLDPAKHLHFACSAGQPVALATTRFIFNGDSVSDIHSPTYYDMGVVMTTDTNGTVEWFKTFDGNTDINGFGAIAQLPNNKIAASGTFAGRLINGTDSIVSPTTEGQNPFFVIIDSAGNLQTIQQIHGDGFYDGSYAITSDNAGNVYIGGKVADSIFGGTIPAYYTTGGNSDFFIMKYGFNCNCTATPVAAYTDTGDHTVGFVYTGATLDLDSVAWNYGDGASDTGLIRSHTYASVGTYTVCATAYTGCGNDTYCNTVNVACVSAPIASFTDTGTHTVGFTYTGTTVAIDSIVWSFGDGGTATGNTAHHSYAGAGTYLVCVTSYTPCGSDSVCHSVVVLPLGVSSVFLANIKVYPNPAMNELSVTGVTNNTIYRLISVTGVSLQQGELHTGSNTVSIQKYAPGVYILELTSQNGEKNMVRVVKE